VSDLLTNAVVTWSAEYYSIAVAQLRSQGRDIPDQILAHVSPAHSENFNLFVIITVDVEARLAKLDSDGRRPLHIRLRGDARATDQPAPAPAGHIRCFLHDYYRDPCQGEQDVFQGRGPHRASSSSVAAAAAGGPYGRVAANKGAVGVEASPSPTSKPI
jgi:hypothetical protein